MIKSLDRRQFMSLSSGASLMFLGVTGYAQDKGLQKHTRQSNALGADIKFTVFHEDKKLADLAINEALAQIEKVEKLMSLYRPDSQLSRLNREGLIRDPDPMLVNVLKKARELSNCPTGLLMSLFNLCGIYLSRNIFKVNSPQKKTFKKQNWLAVDRHPEKSHLYE